MLGAIAGILASRNAAVVPSSDFQGSTSNVPIFLVGDTSTFRATAPSAVPVLLNSYAGSFRGVSPSTVSITFAGTSTSFRAPAPSNVPIDISTTSTSFWGPTPSAVPITLGGTLTDPHFASVVLLADVTSSVLSDKSPVAQLMALGPGASISNAQQLFGDDTLFFNGTSSGYVNGSNGSGLNFGTNDFTLEAWVRTTNATAVQGVIMKWGDSLNRQWGFAIASGNLYALFWDGSLKDFSSAATIPGANQWIHLAVTRQSGLVRLFINGVLDANTLNVPGSLTANTGPVTLGLNQDTSVWPFQGWMTQARVTNGVARYTTSFTPPISKFPQM